MPGVATSVQDVRDQFKVDIEHLKQVAGAFLTVDLAPRPTIHVLTLLHERDKSTDDQVADAELRLMDTFTAVPLNFTRIHLQGRDPRRFVQPGSEPIVINDGRLEEAVRFSVVRFGAHARP